MRCLIGVVLVTVACASTTAPPPATDTPVPLTSAAAPTDAPTTTGETVFTTASPTSPATTPDTSVTSVADRAVLADIAMTSVPPDVIVPTSDASLNPKTNPINGRRGDPRRVPDDIDCALRRSLARSCLTAVLDTLGFNVTGGSTDDDLRSVRRATAVVQLDAGLPMTGVPDDDTLQYLGIGTHDAVEAGADESRQIGTSALGRPIMALRYGDGRRIVLVVGQTHGDEEGGLRVLLRARSLLASRPDGLTLWVITTMNPDGLVQDTRFLANGADPNRHAPSQPEQKAVYDFALATQPSLTVWYHQNYGWVGGSGASTEPARRYQKLTGLGTLRRSGDCVAGFMWCPIDDALGSSSVLVELPDVLTSADVQLHARALLEVASGNAP